MRSFHVQIIRAIEPGVTRVYEMVAEAETGADAGTVLGDKIRANDMDGVTVTGGEHVWVPPGYQANLVYSRARLTDEAHSPGHPVVEAEVAHVELCGKGLAPWSR